MPNVHMFIKTTNDHPECITLPLYVESELKVWQVAPADIHFPTAKLNAGFEPKRIEKISKMFKNDCLMESTSMKAYRRAFAKFLTDDFLKFYSVQNPALAIFVDSSDEEEDEDEDDDIDDDDEETDTEQHDWEGEKNKEKGAIGKKRCFSCLFS